MRHVLRQAPRVIFLGFVVLAVFAVFALRLWNLQFVQGEEFRERADEQRLRSVEIPAPRGIIYDRNGVALVRNVARYNVVIIPAFLPDDAGLKRELTRAFLNYLGAPSVRA